MKINVLAKVWKNRRNPAARASERVGPAGFFQRALGSLLVLATFGFLLWRAQFGVEFLDETQMFLVAFNTVPHGDRLIVDEFQNANRHNDILNYFLLRPWAPFSLLALRRVAQTGFLLCLIFVAGAAYRKRWNLTTAAAISACFLFDAFNVPMLGYNWWCRNFLLLHAGFLWWAEQNTGRGRWVLPGLAGAAMGGAIVAYQPVALAFVFSAATIFVFNAVNREWRRGLERVGIYGLGVLLVWGPDLAYLLSPPVRDAWWAAAVTMTQLRDFHSAQKIASVFGFIVGNRELWVAAVGLWMFGWGARAKRTVGERRLSWAATLLTCLYLGKRLFLTEHDFLILQAIVALGFLSAGWVIYRAFVEKNAFVAGATVASAAAAIGMALVSVTGKTALFWAMPSLILPGLASYQLWVLRAASGPTNRTWAMLPVLILIGVVGLGSVRSQLTHVYFDVAPSEATAVIKTPHLEGIRTSPRRAFLIQELYRLSHGRNFVIAYPDITMPYLWSRSSLNTIQAAGAHPDWVYRDELAYMMKNRRYPEVIILVKTHYWDWGGSDDPPQSLVGAGDSVVRRLADCAGNGTIASLPEFEAVGVDPAKLAGCVARENAAAVTKK